MDDKQYLKTLLEVNQPLNERIEIFSGVVDMQILREASGELWYFNIKAGNFLKVKWVKKAFVVHVYNPKDLKRANNGESFAGVRNMEQPRFKTTADVLAEGSAHVLSRMPWKTGRWMPTIDLFDFNIKGYNKKDIFRVRFENPVVSASAAVTIMRNTSRARIYRIPNLEHRDSKAL
jgi:hypothetical protein